MRRADPNHIRFRDDSQLAYDRPADTFDPRWKACTSHHPACDCREAELGEEIQELHAEWQGIRAAITDVLRGHPIYGADDQPGCRCTGCEITRRIHLSHLAA